MLDVAYSILIIFIFAEALFLFFSIATGENRVISTILLIFTVAIFSCCHINKNILEWESELVAYQQYIEQNTRDQIIDTKIEQDYVAALKNIEYYKKLGLIK